MTRFWLTLALSTVATPSWAVVYSGNPDLSFHVQRPAGDLVSGSATLYKIRVHTCDSGYTDYVIDEPIDPVDGFVLEQIDGGDLCGATWFWSTDMALTGPSYTLGYEDNTTTMVFSVTMAPSALNPWEVTSGTMSGSGPKLYVTID